MIAKLIVHGGDREECITRSKRALAEYDIEGIPTIIPFHRLMLDDEEFVAGTHTTKYLDHHLDAEKIEEAQEKWGTTESSDDDEEVVEREFTVEVNGKRFEVNLEDRGGVAAVPANNGGGGQKPKPAGGSSDGGETVVDAEGETVAAEMQGTILDVKVEEGDEIESGDVVCVLEAMKMENDVVASRGGTVTQIAVSEGDSVDMGDVLVVVD